MRALAYNESSMNPLESRDPAWGLMQVVPDVRTSYNQRYGTGYSQNDLLDPATNVKIASELLNRIAKQYQANHGSDPNMRINWGNPEFVKLVVAGWNSGYSEAGGVGRVASYLRSRGLPVTHDNVFQYAAAAGATRHLQNSTKYNWQRRVADTFYAEGGPGLLDSLDKGLLLVAAGLAGVYLLVREG
jgi:soluble lytic murein transglycosylase-like protein